MGAGQDARRVEHSWPLDAAARFGLSSRGLVYGVLAWIVLRLALGSTPPPADQQGALEQLASAPAGRVLILVAAAGFGAYALWQLLDATVRHASGQWRTRLTALGTAALYAVFCVATLRIAQGTAQQSSDQEQEDATARLLAAGLGRVAVGLVAIGILGWAGWSVWHALTHDFSDTLELQRLPPWLHDIADIAGTAGRLGRSAVVGLVGAFLLGAALTVDASKSKGLDRTLRTVGGEPYGRFLLLLGALGFAAFAVYCVIDGRYRRLD